MSTAERGIFSLCVLFRPGCRDYSFTARETVNMDQQKIGRFLQELRKSNNMTQEQLAEKLYVSGRTVSRWETGSNLPDISVLIALAEMYDVSIPEILSGERKSEKMNEETKETALKVAELGNEEKEKINRRMHWLFMAGLAAGICYALLDILDMTETFWGGLCFGITFGMTIVGTIMTGKNAKAIRNFKRKLLGIKE